MLKEKELDSIKAVCIIEVFTVFIRKQREAEAFAASKAMATSVSSF